MIPRGQIVIPRGQIVIPRGQIVMGQPATRWSRVFPRGKPFPAAINPKMDNRDVLLRIMRFLGQEDKARCV